MTKIKVQVAGTVHEYPADIAGYGDHLAAGGQTVSGAFDLQCQAREFFQTNRDQSIKSVILWVELDFSGLAYRVEVNRCRPHGYKIMAAAPVPGPGNVREIYVA